jgi:hypothetical protein
VRRTDEANKNKLPKLASETVTVTGHIDTDQSTGPAFAYQGTVEATIIVPSID